MDSNLSTMSVVLDETISLHENNQFLNVHSIDSNDNNNNNNSNTTSNGNPNNNNNNNNNNHHITSSSNSSLNSSFNVSFSTLPPMVATVDISTMNLEDLKVLYKKIEQERNALAVSVDDLITENTRLKASFLSSETCLSLERESLVKAKKDLKVLKDHLAEKNFIVDYDVLFNNNNSNNSNNSNNNNTNVNTTASLSSSSSSSSNATTNNIISSKNEEEKQTKTKEVKEEKEKEKEKGPDDADDAAATVAAVVTAAAAVVVAEEEDESDCENALDSEAQSNHPPPSIDISQLQLQAQELCRFCHSPHAGSLISDRKTSNGKILKSSFIAKSFIDFLVSTEEVASREEGVALARVLQSHNIIRHSLSNPNSQITFRDRRLFFNFVSDLEGNNNNNNSSNDNNSNNKSTGFSLAGVTESESTDSTNTTTTNDSAAFKKSPQTNKKVSFSKQPVILLSGADDTPKPKLYRSGSDPDLAATNSRRSFIETDPSFSVTSSVTSTVTTTTTATTSAAAAGAQPGSLASLSSSSSSSLTNLLATPVTRRRAQTISRVSDTGKLEIELSLILEDQVREGILRKYAAPEFTNAAIKIQTCYRHFKLRTRFKSVVLASLAKLHDSPEHSKTHHSSSHSSSKAKDSVDSSSLNNTDSNTSNTILHLNVDNVSISSNSSSYEHLPMIIDVTPASARPSMSNALSPLNLTSNDLPLGWESDDDTASITSDTDSVSSKTSVSRKGSIQRQPHNVEEDDESEPSSPASQKGSDSLSISSDVPDSPPATSQTSKSATQVKMTMRQKLLTQLLPLNFNSIETSPSTDSDDSSISDISAPSSSGSLSSGDNSHNSSHNSSSNNLSTPTRAPTTRSSLSAIPSTPAPLVLNTTLSTKRLLSEDHIRTRQVRIAIHKFNRDSKRGMMYLIDKGFVLEKPRHVAFFLMHQPGLSKRMIGEYLGEPKPFNLEVLEHFSSLIDMTDKDIDGALRLYLASFRLPGEAQKIDRMMNTFAKRYHQNNPHVFAHPDTAYVLAFSIVMLNTDVHNPSVKRKMTKLDFVRNNRGINDNADLPKEFLEGIYDRIFNLEIEPSVDHVTDVEKILANISGKFPNLAVPHRHFVRMGNFIEVLDLTQKIPKGKHIRTLYLFNDVLMITKPARHNMMAVSHPKPAPATTSAAGRPSVVSQSSLNKPVVAPQFAFRDVYPLLGMKIKRLESTKIHANLFELQDFQGLPLILLKSDKEQDMEDFLLVLQDMIEENAELEAERLADMERALMKNTSTAPSVASTTVAAMQATDADLKRSAEQRTSKRFRLSFLPTKKSQASSNPSSNGSLEEPSNGGTLSHSTSIGSMASYTSETSASESIKSTPDDSTSVSPLPVDGRSRSKTSA